MAMGRAEWNTIKSKVILLTKVKYFGDLLELFGVVFLLIDEFIVVSN